MVLSFLSRSSCFQCLWPRRAATSQSPTNPDLYADLQHLQKKPRSFISRENLLLQVQKLVVRVITLIEVSTLMHLLLGFLSFNAPSNFFWDYLGNTKDQSSAIYEGLEDNVVQTRLNILMALLTLGSLIWAYVSNCWTSYEGIRRFSWIFLAINSVTAVILAIQAHTLLLIFSKAVLFGLRGLILIFNMLTVAKCFKLGKLYKMLNFEEYLSQPDIELQPLEQRLLPWTWTLKYGNFWCEMTISVLIC